MNTKENTKTKKIIDLILRKNHKLLLKIETLECEIFDLKKSKELLSVNDLKRKYGVSRSTLDRYRKQGLPILQPVMNGKLYVDEVEFQKFLKGLKKW